ncbi:MAG: hypothetical protein Q9166_006038 [cf. Caloplaca sp. 2 TL-2023]
MSDYERPHVQASKVKSNKNLSMRLQKPCVKASVRSNFYRWLLHKIAVTAFLAGWFTSLGAMVTAPTIANWGLVNVVVHNDFTKMDTPISLGAFGYCIFDVQTEDYGCSTLQTYYNVTKVILHNSDMSVSSANARLEYVRFLFVAFLPVLSCTPLMLVYKTLEAGNESITACVFCHFIAIFFHMYCEGLFTDLRSLVDANDGLVVEKHYLGLYANIFAAFLFWIALMCVVVLKDSRQHLNGKSLEAKTED